MATTLAELARIDRRPQPLRAAPSRSIAGLAGVHLTVAGDGSGQNCIDRAAAALQFCPSARAVIGSLILRGGRCLRTGRLIHSCKPWHHHAWLIKGQQGHHDPSLQNLELWAEVEAMELPDSIARLSRCTVSSRRAQAQILRAIAKAEPLPADLNYLPGLVFSSDLEESPPSPAYVHAWGRVASDSIRAGGFDRAQLLEACARVPAYMAESPRLRRSEIT